VAGAKIRLFCLTLPNPGPQLGLRYALACEKTGLGVVVCPIGLFSLMGGPWQDHLHLFVGAIDADFVNIVVSPPGLLLGQTLKERDVKPPAGLGGPLPLGTPAQGSEIVYRPLTALAGLHTAGVPNVAVTMVKPRLPEAAEIEALSRYDLVFTPTIEDLEVLLGLGVTALLVPPESESFEALIRGLC
jgi:hypothetical protein